MNILFLVNPPIDIPHTDLFGLTNLDVSEFLQLKSLADSKVFKDYRHLNSLHSFIFCLFIQFSCILCKLNFNLQFT